MWQQLKNLQVLDVSENPVINILQGDLDGLESLHSLWIYGLMMCIHLEKKAFISLSNLVKLRAYGYPGLGYLDMSGILQNVPPLEKMDILLKDATVNGVQLSPALQPCLQELGLRRLRVRSPSLGVLAGLRGHLFMWVYKTLHFPPWLQEYSLFFPAPVAWNWMCLAAN